MGEGGQAATGAPPIVLVHGTFANDRCWSSFPDRLRERGFDVHLPVIRHHDTRSASNSEAVGKLTLKDYVDDVVTYVERLGEPPILLGHSLGGLVVQQAAMRTRTRGLILAAPAPSRGMFHLYPTMVLSFVQHFLQWGFWRKPLRPRRWVIDNMTLQNQDQKTKDELWENLVDDSGRLYTSLAFWTLDPSKSTAVDPEKIDVPVLVLAGSEDRMVHPRIGRLTAKRLADSRFVSIEGGDHGTAFGPFEAPALAAIDEWTKAHGLAAEGNATSQGA